MVGHELDLQATEFHVVGAHIGDDIDVGTAEAGLVAELREFKLCLAQNLAVNARFMANSVTHTDSFSELAMAMKETLTTALADAASDLDIAAFAAALDVIATARHLCVLPADQLSQGSALDTHIRLLRMGMESSVHLVPDEQRMIIGSARGDVGFILLTTDPSALDGSDLLDILNNQDNPAILISPSRSRPSFQRHPPHYPQQPAAGNFRPFGLRYKQALVIDLLCTGHSLNLSEGLTKPRRPVNEQLPPPLKPPGEIRSGRTDTSASRTDASSYFNDP
ncbi:hypothetical protein [Pelagibacterium mangrovi]|uniref:hypothetical protein n=1 Tax=Pelagibacterium mangrovi TaxID=3119828 RepID=UPI002FC719CA